MTNINYSALNGIGSFFGSAYQGNESIKVGETYLQPTEEVNLPLPPVAAWEKQQGFSNPFIRELKTDEMMQGVIVSCIAMFLHFDGNVAPLPSFEYARSGKNPTNKVSLGEGGFLTPDLSIQLGLYTCSEGKVLMPENVQQAYSKNNGRHEKVMLSFTESPNRIPAVELYLKDKINNLVQGLPFGPFALLLVGTVKGVEETSHQSYGRKVQIGNFRLSVRPMLKTGSRSGRKPIVNDKTTAFLKQQLEALKLPQPVEVVTQTPEVCTLQPQSEVRPTYAPVEVASTKDLEANNIQALDGLDL